MESPIYAVRVPHHFKNFFGIVYFTQYLRWSTSYVKDPNFMHGHPVRSFEDMMCTLHI